MGVDYQLREREGGEGGALGDLGVQLQVAEIQNQSKKANWSRTGCFLEEHTSARINLQVLDCFSN